jgi:hypothetical protein
MSGEYKLTVLLPLLFKKRAAFPEAPPEGAVFPPRIELRSSPRPEQSAAIAAASSANNTVFPQNLTYCKNIKNSNGPTNGIKVGNI